MTGEEQLLDGLRRLDLLSRLENTVTFLEMRPLAEQEAGGAVRYATALKEHREAAIAWAVAGLLSMDRLAAGGRAPIRAVAG